MRRCRSRMLIGVSVLMMAASGVLARGNGLKLYIAHEFDKAIEETKNGKDISSMLVLALSYAEKSNLYKVKTDKDQAKMYLKMLEVDLKIKDAKMVESFLNIEGNLNGNKEAAKLLKKCFENAQCGPGDILLVATFIDPAKGTDVCELSLSTISKRLGTVRDYVSKGAAMPKEMQNLFSNRELIEPIVGALDNKKTMSAARKCLLLIEEPALAILEKKELTPVRADVIVDIKKAITKRMKKYPNSTWYSASGA